jgi:hypothetical protein
MSLINQSELFAYHTSKQEVKMSLNPLFNTFVLLSKLVPSQRMVFSFILKSYHFISLYISCILLVVQMHFSARTLNSLIFGAVT